jgi:GTP-binding protein EngB required for normal cell division
VVATKIDKISHSAQKPALARLAGSPKRAVVATSAESGQGRELLWTRILDACRVH